MYFGVLCHRWTASTATGRVWSPSPTSSGSTSTAWNTSSTRCNINIDLKILAPHQPEVLVSCLLFPPKQIHTLPHLLWLVGINDFIIRFFYCRKKKSILIRCKTTTVIEHDMLTEDIATKIKTDQIAGFPCQDANLPPLLFNPGSHLEGPVTPPSIHF